MAFQPAPVSTPLVSAAIPAVPSRMPSVDERWATWHAKGLAHDAAVRRKLTIVAPIVAIIAAIIVYTLVLG